jgi:[phosphatase 2A protein]-leucine-carboxy methyltransferase
MSLEWTNSESSRSKAAIATLGYTTDPFIHLLCHSSLKRTPEINRGYYARTVAVEHLIKQFCQREGQSAQIVNIGSGSDSLYWRLKSDKNMRFGRFVDVDSSQVIATKVHSIHKTKQLNEMLSDIREPKEDCLHSSDYHLMVCDATKTKKLTDLLTNECEVNRSDPVLFVFECVLLYWASEQTSALIHGLSHIFKSCAFLVFDLVNTNDAFAHIMQDSLSERDAPLLGIADSTTLEDWKQKFVTNGCKYGIAWDMNTVYNSLIPYADRERVEKIEFLDETELLTQLLGHYCLVLASNYCPVDWE